MLMVFSILHTYVLCLIAIHHIHELLIIGYDLQGVDVSSPYVGEQLIDAINIIIEKNYDTMFPMKHPVDNFFVWQPS